LSSAAGADATGVADATTDVGLVAVVLLGLQAVRLPRNSAAATTRIPVVYFFMMAPLKCATHFNIGGEVRSHMVSDS
jgi:hypothetical protein